MASYPPLQVNENGQNIRADFGEKRKQMLRMLSFIREFEATCHYACDPKTPFCVKAAVLAALAHCEMPPDVIPDFIVCLGFTDCAAVF
tara:strand:+ start:390 stop:653 length:264 start_codon:yes stop_codon:yes gene_type:complete